MTKPHIDPLAEPCCRKMTVAHIRQAIRADSVEVVFLESARFYRLLKSNPAFDQVLKRLREAMARRQVLEVRLASLDSDLIEDVSGA